METPLVPDVSLVKPLDSARKESQSTLLSSSVGTPDSRDSLLRAIDTPDLASSLIPIPSDTKTWQKFNPRFDGALRDYSSIDESEPSTARGSVVLGSPERSMQRSSSGIGVDVDTMLKRFGVAIELSQDPPSDSNETLSDSSSAESSQLSVNKAEPLNNCNSPTPTSPRESTTTQATTRPPLTTGMLRRETASFARASVTFDVTSLHPNRDSVSGVGSSGPRLSIVNTPTSRPSVSGPSRPSIHGPTPHRSATLPVHQPSSTHLLHPTTNKAPTLAPTTTTTTPPTTPTKTRTQRSTTVSHVRSTPAWTHIDRGPSSSSRMSVATIDQLERASELDLLADTVATPRSRMMQHRASISSSSNPLLSSSSASVSASASSLAASAPVDHPLDASHTIEEGFRAPRPRSSTFGGALLKAANWVGLTNLVSEAGKVLRPSISSGESSLEQSEYSLGDSSVGSDARKLLESDDVAAVNVPRENVAAMVEARLSPAVKTLPDARGNMKRFASARGSAGTTTPPRPPKLFTVAELQEGRRLMVERFERIWQVTHDKAFDIDVREAADVWAGSARSPFQSVASLHSMPGLPVDYEKLLVDFRNPMKIMETLQPDSQPSESSAPQTMKTVGSTDNLKPDTKPTSNASTSPSAVKPKKKKFLEESEPLIAEIQKMEDLVVTYENQYGRGHPVIQALWNRAQVKRRDLRLLLASAGGGYGREPANSSINKK